MFYSITSWPPNKAEREQLIRGAIPPNSFSYIKKAIDEAAKLELPLYLVGGFVRDLLLGYPVNDIDLVLEGDAVAFSNILIQKYGGQLKIHRRFGAAKWQFPDVSSSSGFSEVDLISSRSEEYKNPGSLPTVHFNQIAEDLKRRDFTINAIALCLDVGHFGDILDDFGGLEDLQRRKIRALHPNSFIDDPTRIFRAVRYSVRYDFTISSETLDQISRSLPWIEMLSSQRIRHELDLVFDEEKAADILLRLNELKILEVIQAKLTLDMTGYERIERAVQVNIRDRNSYRWILWLMDLDHAQIVRLGKRLHFRANIQKLLIGASKLYHLSDSLVRKTPSQCVELLNTFPVDSIRAVFLATPSNRMRLILEKYLIEWRYIKPKTNGYALREMGIDPGPIYNKILKDLRNAWLDGEVRSGAEEKALLMRLVKKV